jgi:ubiquinone/menaquinone biosynthesis C-methylase UbiE
MKNKINLMFNKTGFIVFLALLCSTVFAQSARDNWQQPRRVMDSLGVQSGMVIGEVGAGDGYFTWFLAERVGDSGKVYANDIDDDELDKIRRKVLRDSLTNIIPILGETTETNFPDSTMDMVIMVYVFHHLEEPVPFFRKLTRTLKPGAPVVIVERDPEKYDGWSGHFYPKDKVLQIIEDTGYRVSKIYTFLSRDNIYVIYLPPN